MNENAIFILFLVIIGIIAALAIYANWIRLPKKKDTKDDVSRKYLVRRALWEKRKK